MIISHTHEFILLAPWKCASSTCHARLHGYNESPYPDYFHFNPHLNRVAHQHLTLDAFRLLPEAKLGYKSAAFVRNPYDRAYSGFLQVQRDFQEQPGIEVEPRWILELVRAQIASNMERVIKAGFQFDEWIGRLPDYEIHDAGSNTNMPLHPVHYWTHAEGPQQVEFVGKVEDFESDFSSFCQFAGIDMPPLVNANRSSSELAGEGLYKYAQRMERRSIDRINDLFAKDFEHFDYAML